VQSLLEKLGVSPDLTVALVGVTDHEFVEALGNAGPRLFEHAVPKGTDMVFLQAETREGLDTALSDVARLIQPDGSIWVLWPKGRLRLKQADIMAAGAVAGLVDVKVADFSEVFSALKFVIPNAKQ
jgi:hypothetical protein